MAPYKITMNDAYVRIITEILTELDLSFFDEKLINQLLNLSLPAKHLIMRLYLRQHKWITGKEFSKYIDAQILENEVLPELVTLGWLETDPKLEDIIRDLATTKDMQLVFKELGVPLTSIKKQEYVSKLKDLAKQQAYFIASGKIDKLLAKNVDTRAYKLSIKGLNLLRALEIMFLEPCGPQSGLDQVVLSYMNKVKFLEYEYICQRDSPIFEPKEFLEYVDLRRFSDKVQLMYEKMDATYLDQVVTEFIQIKLPDYRRSLYVYYRTVFNLSKLLMKAHKFQLEYEYLQMYIEQQYHKSKLCDCLIRKLLLELRFLQNSQTTGENSWLTSAINTYFDALSAVHESSDRGKGLIAKLDLDKKVPKLISAIKKSGLQSALPIVQSHEYTRTLEAPNTVFTMDPKEAADKVEDLGTRKRTRVMFEGDLVVEQVVLLQYPEFDAGGHYETSYILTIFWLCIYDLVFKYKEKLRCKYQTAPMDLPWILEQEKEAILERAGSASIYIERAYKTLETKPQIIGINWRIPEEQVLLGAEILGVKLRCIFDRLCSNYFASSSGFPDLTLINTKTREIVFIEVKSERDTISDNQRLWFQFLIENGVNAQVCKVISMAKLEQQLKSKKRRV